MGKIFFFSGLILHFQKHKFNLQYPFCLPTSQTQVEMDFHLALAKSLLEFRQNQPSTFSFLMPFQCSTQDTFSISASSDTLEEDKVF